MVGEQQTGRDTQPSGGVFVTGSRCEHDWRLNPVVVATTDAGGTRGRSKGPRVVDGAGHDNTRAELRLQVGWGDIPGRPVLHQTVFFDGTPDGFDVVIEEMKVAFRKAAAAPMRPCGYAGPWHESLWLEDRLLRPDDDRNPQSLS